MGALLCRTCWWQCLRMAAWCRTTPWRRYGRTPGCRTTSRIPSRTTRSGWTSASSTGSTRSSRHRGLRNAVSLGAPPSRSRGSVWFLNTLTLSVRAPAASAVHPPKETLRSSRWDKDSRMRITLHEDGQDAFFSTIKQNLRTNGMPDVGQTSDRLNDHNPKQHCHLQEEEDFFF